jgi:hypothetical protein
MAKTEKNDKTARLVALAEAINQVDNTTIKPSRKTAKTNEPLSLSPSVATQATIKKKEKAVLSITISDLHLGHLGFLPQTYWSTIDNLVKKLETLSRFYQFVRVNVIFNGDIVSGKEIYETQVFDNAISRGHWQVTLAAEVLYQTITKIKRTLKIPTRNSSSKDKTVKAEDTLQIFIVKGTHEPESENYAIYLSREIDAKYLSRYPIINLGEPLGYYPVLFMHGVGSNINFPISTATIRQCQNYLLQNPQKRCNTIRTAHTHWLTPEFEIGGGLKIAVNGGFQKCEYKLDQRPSGLLIDIFTKNGETINMTVRPDPNVERDEKEDGLLEFRNYAYYGRTLLNYGRRIIGAVDSGVLYRLFRDET